MSKITTTVTKTLVVKPNNNSADAISPNYVYGCLGGCMSSYCYVGRYNRDKVIVTKNVTDIHHAIIEWAEPLVWPKVPNQQDGIYYMVDIGCNTDIALHQKHIDLDRILAFYDEHPKINLTFATKYSRLLKTDVTWMKKKPRVRVSLMPQCYSSILEPDTTTIKKRIEDIKRLQDLGWEVHINFSPVIVTNKPEFTDTVEFNPQRTAWLTEYVELFKLIDTHDFDKSTVKCEVIFLTNHFETMIKATPEARHLLSGSNEYKNDTVMRYPISHKTGYVTEFKFFLYTYIPWCTIRYIF